LKQKIDNECFVKILSELKSETLISAREIRRMIGHNDKGEMRSMWWGSEWGESRKGIRKGTSDFKIER